MAAKNISSISGHARGPLQFTPVEAIPKIYENALNAFRSGSTRPLPWRLNQLKQIGYMIQENEEKWTAALASDLGRPAAEAHLAELMGMKNDVNEMLKALPAWVTPKRVKTTLTWAATSPTIYYEPKGTVLVLGTWNYPIALALGPVLGAIAGGNSVVVKPSEQSPAVAALMAELIPQYLDPQAILVVNGAISETAALLDLKWDHIFFTGSGDIGKIVARAAADHLTPVTLELGGKSPAIVCEDADLETTGRRLMWGKVVNAGQTCIAPDYVLAPAHLQDKLVASMKAALEEFYPSSNSSHLESDQFSKIVNPNHFSRLKSMLEGTKGKVVIGGEMDEAKNKIAVTVVKNVNLDDTLMANEIFGPLLPIVTFEDKEEAVKLIESRDQPLALYVFTKNKRDMEFFRNHTRSGQILYNDVLVQHIIPGLPFGGTGPSGTGNYHGKHSFLTFTHERASASVGFWMEPLLASRYPPYTDGKLKLMKLATGSSISGHSKLGGGKACADAAANMGILGLLVGSTMRGRLLRLAIAVLIVLLTRQGSTKL